nr:hypothetical protein [Tanacetum cinerariifolium]
MDVQAPTTVASLTLSAPTLTPSTIATISTVPQAPPPPTTALSTLLQDLPNFGSLFGFNHQLKTLKANFSEFMQTNHFVGAVSSILGIVQRYMDQRMNEAVKVAVQIQSDKLCDKAHEENEEFLKNLDENILKIIKEQVKEQVKVQVSKILPKIEKTVNEKLEAEVLTQSSNSSNTSYDVASDLSEMELKKILIEKMQGNMSIHRSDEQRNLYKALVKAYESDKIILDTYGDVVTLKRRHDDDADKDEEPSARSDWGSKRRREGKEPESTSAPKEKATRTTRKSTRGSKSQQRTASESAPAEEPMQTTQDLEEPSHQEFETAFLMNRLKVDTLTPDLLVGPTYELIKGSCKSLVELEFFLEEVYKETTDQLDWNNPEGQQYPHNLLKPLPLIPNSRGRRVIPFDHFINNDLKYLRGGASIRKYTTSVTKTKAADYWHIKCIKDLVPRTMWSQELVSYDKHALWGISHWGRKHKQFYGFAVNRESARDVYSKRRIFAVTELQIVEWHNYKHLDWITVRRDDDKLYKFKEGDFKRLCIQDIEDMLLLLVQGKLTNLTVEECFAFNVSLRMFTRSIVIQRRVEDIQLGVKSYQKKLNLIRPNTYRSDLKRKEAYTAYSNPRGLIFQNKDKQNRLMRIDELHKFSDRTLIDVCTALDDHLKGIRMRSVLMDSQVTPTKPGRITKPYSSHRFIANYFNTRRLKMEVKVLKYQLLSVSLLICLGIHNCVERIPSGNSLHCHEPNSEGSGSAWKAYMNARVAGLFLLDETSEPLLYAGWMAGPYWCKDATRGRNDNPVTSAEGDLRNFSDIGAWVQVPRCMAWLNYDEHVDSLSTMDNEVGVTSPDSTVQTLPLFKEYTPLVTYPEEVEKTLGTPIEVEPLNETKLEEVGLNCNHNTPLSSREVSSFDKPEPQPQPLPNCPPLDASLGTKRGLKPPIKSQSPDRFRMNVLDNLTIHTPPSSLVASFHLRDLYYYYRLCINDPKKYYGYKTALLGHSGSLGVDFLKLEMIDDDWGLESKEVYFLGSRLNSPIWPKEVEKRRNRQDYGPTPTFLKIIFSAAGDGVTISMVHVPRCMAWLNYDEHVDSLSTMDNEVGVTSPKSTIQTLPSFEKYTWLVTFPKEVEKNLGTPIEVEPLNETKLEELGLNCNHNTPLSSREVSSFDKPEPQPQPLPNCPPLDASLGTKRGLKPPIKSQSPNRFRMKVLDNLTIHTPPSSLMASFHLRDLYYYYRLCINDPKKYYGYKTALLGHSGSLGVDFLKLEMIDDYWGLESKEVYFLGRGLNSPIWPKEVEKELTYGIKCMKFFIKNKNFVFTDCGDGVTINTRRRQHDTCLVTTWKDLVEKFIKKFYQLSDGNEEIEVEEDDDPDDITDIFKIEGNLFDYKTPLCKAFNDFNYLLKINRGLFTFNIQGIRTYEEYKLNNPMTMDLGEPWLDNGVPYQLSTWDGSGQKHNLFPRSQVNDELADGKLKEETLMHKAKVEESWGNATPVTPFTRLESYGQRPYANIKTEKAHEPYLEVNNIFGRNYDTSNAQDNQGHEKCKDDPTLEPSVCKFRRFEMIKYSFNANKECIAIKESEYLNHSKDNLDAYREFLRIIDEGWVVATPAEE